MLKDDKNKIIDWKTVIRKKEISELLKEELWEDDFIFDDDFFEFVNARNDLAVPKEVQLLDDLYFDIKALEEIFDSSNDWEEFEEDSLPYFNEKLRLASLYKTNGLYQKALHLFQELSKDDDSDSCRYEIMSLYILMSNYVSAKAFYESNASYESDSLLKTLLLIGAILADDNAMAYELLKQLFDEIEEFEEFCLRSDLSLGKILVEDDSGLTFDYAENDIEVVYTAFRLVLPLVERAANYLSGYLSSYCLNTATDVLLEDVDFLTIAQLEVFEENGIYSINDFKIWSEEEILNLPKIGKITIEHLKNIGVIFSH